MYRRYELEIEDITCDAWRLSCEQSRDRWRDRGRAMRLGRLSDTCRECRSSEVVRSHRENLGLGHTHVRSPLAAVSDAAQDPIGI